VGAALTLDEFALWLNLRDVYWEREGRSSFEALSLFAAALAIAALGGAFLRAAARNVRVNLDEPDLTCRIEITPGPMLVYARKIPGTGGLPANTAGRMVCLLSGGFDSAVAAYKMMRRGAHLTFVHFWGGGARPGPARCARCGARSPGITCKARSRT